MKKSRSSRSPGVSRHPCLLPTRVRGRSCLANRGVTYRDWQKKGQRHPDPRTAQVAFEWALPRTSSRDGVLASLGIDVVFEALFGGAGVGAGATWAEARLARRIAALGDHKVDATP